MKMYTVHDAAAKAYLPPFTQKSERDALSAFEEAANDSQSAISKYPADFTLIELGDFDERTGKLTLLPENLNIANAAKFKKD